MSAAELSRRINVPTNRITQIISGRRSITGDTALRLGALLWNQPRVLDELRVAERQVGNDVKALPRLAELRGAQGSSRTPP